MGWMTREEIIQELQKALVQIRRDEGYYLEAYHKAEDDGEAARFVRLGHWSQAYDDARLLERILARV